jgi:hypothetical protein
MLKRTIGQLPLVVSVALASVIMTLLVEHYTNQSKSCDLTCPAGLSGYEIVTDGPYVVTGGSDKGVACPVGKKVIGGGVSTNPSGGTIIENSYPLKGSPPFPDYWRISIIPLPNYDIGPFNATFYAICVTAP